MILEIGLFAAAFFAYQQYNATTSKTPPSNSTAARMKAEDQKQRDLAAALRKSGPKYTGPLDMPVLTLDARNLAKAKADKAAKDKAFQQAKAKAAAAAAAAQAAQAKVAAQADRAAARARNLADVQKMSPKEFAAMLRKSGRNFKPGSPY